MTDFICPVDCSTFPFEASFDDCTPAYNFGEITRIYIAALDYEGLDDITDDTELAAEIAAGNVVGLQVKGALGEPEQDTTEGVDGVDINTTPKFTLNFEILEITQENYEMMQATYCNIPVRMWYETRDARYGGNAGIAPCKFKMHHLIEQGFNTLQKLPGMFQWFARTAPARSLKVVPS